MSLVRATDDGDTTTVGTDGWSNRGAFDEPRLSDVVEMYEEAGFEVRLEPFDPDSLEGCAACMRVDPLRYKTVFTRRKV